MAEYPEHEKLKALGGANQIVGDFIEWLGQHGYEIGVRDGDHLVWCGKNRDQLLAEHFEIDQRALNREKEQMLADFVAQRDGQS